MDAVGTHSLAWLWPFGDWLNSLGGQPKPVALLSRLHLFISVKRYHEGLGQGPFRHNMVIYRAFLTYLSLDSITKIK